MHTAGSGLLARTIHAAIHAILLLYQLLREGSLLNICQCLGLHSTRQGSCFRLPEAGKPGNGGRYMMHSCYTVHSRYMMQPFSGTLFSRTPGKGRQVALQLMSQQNQPCKARPEVVRVQYRMLTNTAYRYFTLATHVNTICCLLCMLARRNVCPACCCHP